MSESPKICIGKTSDGKLFSVPLDALPNLFVSYSEPMQFQDFIKIIAAGLNKMQGIKILADAASTKMLESARIENVSVNDFRRNVIDNTEKLSAGDFIAAVFEEMRRREKAALQISHLPVIVFMEDIFEIIRSKNKKVAVRFIEILLDGHLFDMYLVVGSPGIYRNLLEQLITPDPKLKERLTQSVHARTAISGLGAELVINPDGLQFFRRDKNSDFLKLYPSVAIAPHPQQMH